jgi:hypothetical protein
MQEEEISNFDIEDFLEQIFPNKGIEIEDTHFQF